MPREFNIYDGVAPSAPEVHVQRPDVLPALQGHGHEVNAALGGAFQAVYDYAKLRDFGVAQDLERKRRENEAEAEREWESKTRLPWGSEGSVFNEDGTLNEDELRGFVSKWQDKESELHGEGVFWTREGATKAENASLDAQQKVALDAVKAAGKQELQNRRRLFEDNYELAVRKGDWNRACAVVDEAVAGGQITKPRGEIMKLRAGKAALAGRGGVSVGGQEYDGLDAAYAAAAVKSGYKANGEQEGQQAVSARDWTLSGMPEEVSLKGTEGMETEVATPGVASSDITLNAEMLRETTEGMQVGDEWLRMGDFSGVLRGLEPNELMELQDEWDEKYALRVEDGGDAGTGVVYTAGMGAPDAVELVAASGNADGVPSREAVEAMVSNVIFGELGRDSGLSVDDLVRVFDKSGAARVLGDGDEEVGKNVIAGMAREAKSRSSAGRNKLSADDINAMVNLQVNGESYGAGEEWRAMETLNPSMEKNKAYEYPKEDAEQQKRWVALKAAYMKYRDEYNPAMKGQEFTDKEFAEKAQGFWQWYMGGSNKHKDAKAASQAAGKDWYKAAALQKLMEMRDGDEEVGYADELQAVREVLKEKFPLAPAVERMLNDKLELSMRANNSNKKRMEGAQPYYEKLRAMKEHEKANSEKAEAARKREDAARVKAEQKAQEAADKRESLRRKVELQTPRVGGWRWNGKPTSGERIAMCRVPKGEYERLVELGYDGTQRVFMQVGSKQVLVDMSAPASGGDIMMNAPACEIVQPKAPRGKRQVAKVLQGSTDFYFIFKS